MDPILKLQEDLQVVATTMGDFITQQKAAQEKGLDTKSLDAKIIEQIKAQFAIESTLASTGDLAKLELRVKGLERAPGRKRQAGSRSQNKRSLARAWAHEIKNSAAIKRFLSDKDQCAYSDEIKIKSIDPVLTGDAAPEPDRDPDWVVEPPRVTVLRDLIPVTTTDKKVVEFVKQDKYFYIYTNVSTGGTVVVPAATPTAVDVDNAEAFKVGAIVFKDDAETDFGTITAVDRDTAQNTITINSAAGFTATAAERLWSKDFIWTREAKPKPSGKIKYVPVQVTVRSIDTIHYITEDTLEDEPQLAVELETQAIPDMRFKEEEQFFNGTGTDGEMLGFMANTDIQEYKWSDGQVGDTKFDALWRARGIARLNNTAVDGAAISVQDNTDMAITKGEDGHYITRLTVDAAGNVSGMGMMFLEADALAEGSALVGSFGTGAQIKDRTGILVKAFTEWQGALQEGIIAIRFRQRTILLVKRAKSFVRVALDDAPPE